MLATPVALSLLALVAAAPIALVERGWGNHYAPKGVVAKCYFVPTAGDFSHSGPSRHLRLASILVPVQYGIGSGPPGVVSSARAGPAATTVKAPGWAAASTAP